MYVIVEKGTFEVSTKNRKYAKGLEERKNKTAVWDPESLNTLQASSTQEIGFHHQWTTINYELTNIGKNE